MGHVEIDHANGTLKIYSHIITYGEAADEIVTERMRREIETMWNAPGAIAYINHNHYKVVFEITCSCKPNIAELEVCRIQIRATIISELKISFMATSHS